MLRERVAAGGTVIMTTHILEVAERMADRIGVIAQAALDRRRHAGGAAPAHRQDRHSLEDTFLTLVAEPVAAA